MAVFLEYISNCSSWDLTIAKLQMRRIIIEHVVAEKSFPASLFYELIWLIKIFDGLANARKKRELDWPSFMKNFEGITCGLELRVSKLRFLALVYESSHRRTITSIPLYRMIRIQIRITGMSISKTELENDDGAIQNVPTNVKRSIHISSLCLRMLRNARRSACVCQHRKHKVIPKIFNDKIIFFLNRSFWNYLNDIIIITMPDPIHQEAMLWFGLPFGK
jgi:hypothetical protein